jgi:hypothetical protein
MISHGPGVEPYAYLREVLGRIAEALITCQPSCCNGRMNMLTVDSPSYSGYRFPAVIISHPKFLCYPVANDGNAKGESVGGG